MSGTAADNQFVAMAEVVKAVGLKGELKLYPLLDFFAPVLDSRFVVWEDGSPVQVAGHRPAGACEVMRLTACGTREGAEDLVGRRLGFARGSHLDPAFPRPDGGLPFRWLGRRLVTVAGEAVGDVGEVRWTGGQYLLVVQTGRGEVLIPAVAPILAADSGLDGDLVIDPPRGLLDVASG